MMKRRKGQELEVGAPILILFLVLGFFALKTVKILDYSSSSAQMQDAFESTQMNTELYALLNYNACGPDGSATEPIGTMLRHYSPQQKMSVIGGKTFDVDHCIKSALASMVTWTNKNYHFEMSGDEGTVLTANAALKGKENSEPGDNAWTREETIPRPMGQDGAAKTFKAKLVMWRAGQ